MSHKTNLFEALLIAAALLMSAAPAAAQDFDYGVAAAQATQQTYLSSVTSNNIIRGMYDGGRHVGTSAIYVGRPGSRDVRDRLAATASGPIRGGGVFARPADPAAASIALPYRSTPALRRAAADGLVDRLSQKNPEAARVIAEQLRQHDFARIYSGIVAPFGYRSNDAADAVAAYTLLGWLIATGAPDPSPRAAQSVRAQIAQQLAADPRFADASTRAELGEEMKLLFITLHAGWQSAKREGNLRQYSEGVAAMFAKQSGNDLRAMRLTEQGFARG